MTLEAYIPIVLHLLEKVAFKFFLDLEFIHSFKILMSVYIHLFYGEMWLKRQENWDSLYHAN